MSPNTLTFKQSIARIYGRQDTIVGAGFFTSQRRILTCAHVVQSAMDLLDEQRGQIRPDQTTIRVDFPLLTLQTFLPTPMIQETTIEGTLTFCDWSCDIAIITLPEECEIVTQEPCPFAPVEPNQNGNAHQMWEHKFRAFGFPVGEEKGVWATGQIMDENGDRTIQLERVRATGKAVEQGFSGTPVWNDDLNGVVGLMVQASRDPSERIAYMIPLPVLQTVAGELPTAPTVSDRAYLAGQVVHLEMMDKSNLIPNKNRCEIRRPIQ